jgi:hypothetical protein
MFNHVVEACINIVEPNIVLTTHVEKKWKAQWQVIRNFQNTWVAKFPWVEPVIREDCKLHHLQCRICTNVEHRENLLMPILDGLNKHSGKRMC